MRINDTDTNPSPESDHSAQKEPWAKILSLENVEGLIKYISSHANALNPDGDQVITKEEMSAFFSDELPAFAKEFDGTRREIIGKGETAPTAPLSDIIKHRVAVCNNPSETLSAEQRARVEKGEETARSIQSEYTSFVTNIQLRSSPLGDLLISEEEKNITPKLPPDAAREIPLYINFPNREEACHLLRNVIEEAEKSQPSQNMTQPPGTTAPAKRKSR